MATKELFLGIDGGGTKTTCLVVDRAGAELARRATSATNPNVVTLEVAAKRVTELVRETCQEVKCTTDDVVGAVLGLAGAGSEGNRRFLIRHLQNQFGDRFPVQIETDAHIAVEGAFGGGPGIAVIAGTGSAIIAKTPKGEVFNVGGWGRALGDEGSGYFFGVEAAKAFTKLVDGLAESSMMNRLFSERLGWTTREHLLTAVYNEKLELSTLAPLVLELAAMGDALAQEILYRGAQALAEQVLAARARAAMSSVRVATLGGLIDKPTVYRDILVATLHDADPAIEVCMPDKSAVEGAAIMAIRGSGDMRNRGL